MAEIVGSNVYDFLVLVKENKVTGDDIKEKYDESSGFRNFYHSNYPKIIMSPDLCKKIQNVLANKKEHSEYLNENTVLKIFTELLDRDLGEVDRKNGVKFPLLWASFSHSNIVDLLLERNADPNAKSPEGETPLMRATYFANIDIVEKLLSSGADQKIANNKGQTALDIAKHQIVICIDSQRKNYEKIIKILEKNI
jgi:hypothetical protein